MLVLLCAGFDESGLIFVRKRLSFFRVNLSTEMDVRGGIPAAAWDGHTQVGDRS